MFVYRPTGRVLADSIQFSVDDENAVNERHELSV